MKTITSREDWGAIPPKSQEPLKLPVEVVIMMDTLSDECTEPEECKKIVKELQRVYMEEKGFDDIPWSFMIGGDGHVYEGRGWKIKPFKTDLTNSVQKMFDGMSLDIAYIGNYQNKYAPRKMQITFGKLNVYALDNDYITFIHDLKSCIKKQSRKEKLPKMEMTDVVKDLVEYGLNEKFIDEKEFEVESLLCPEGVNAFTKF